MCIHFLYYTFVLTFLYWIPPCSFSFLLESRMNSCDLFWWTDCLEFESGPLKTITLNNYLPVAVQLLLTDVHNYDSDVLLYFLHISTCRFSLNCYQLKETSGWPENLFHSCQNRYSVQNYRTISWCVCVLDFRQWLYCCDKHGIVLPLQRGIRQALSPLAIAGH